LTIRPEAGWGAPAAAAAAAAATTSNTSQQQRATAGWLSALQVFEPHWQVRACGCYVAFKVKRHEILVREQPYPFCLLGLLVF
jgi:hypothetical protein